MPVYDTMTLDEFDYDLKRKLMHTIPKKDIKRERKPITSMNYTGTTANMAATLL